MILTVRELIALLSTFDPGLPVVMPNPDEQSFVGGAMLSEEGILIDNDDSDYLDIPALRLVGAYRVGYK